MSFSVVILSKNAVNLEACVRAIKQHEAGPRIIVVDDGLNSTAELWLEASVQFVLGAKPFIFARNANIGIEVAGDDVILLNDDALLDTPGGFSALSAAAAAHPEFGVISAVTNVVGNLAQRPQGGNGLREEPRTLAFVCVYIPRATIDRVGLLDERYCLDYGVEDNDYCKAVRQVGLKLGIFDGCYVD